MANLSDEIGTAMAQAVKGLRAYGCPWAEIASRLGITRQAAQQRWAATSRPHTAAIGGYLASDPKMRGISYL
jgi:hypothetical protein